MKWIFGLVVGLLVFLISSLGSSLLLPPGLFITIVTGGVGSLLFLVLLGYRKNLLKNVGLSMIGLVVAFLVGFGIGEASSLLPIGDIMPNVIFFVTAATVYGTFMGLILHGKKELGFFILTSLIAGVVLTAIVFLAGLMKGQFWNGIDLNYIVIMSTLGTVAGLAIGLYQDKRKLKQSSV
ncbi:hypothetical protein QMA09_15080 [Planococcus sp. APC 3906]|uniref:hypothetical protein n=1 Tax=Planococcus sp. APC 3906 TaxID=3035194 RepID=UPI0025B54888|nr:hypothetical protein [Planococcus sp. APC 3906]MDN3451521.1 hypothetical protein [Planococcus sp. APC 3906]